jgi:serine/threonine protein kinase
MPKAASVSHFFKSERSAEALYEVSHRIGKGSYGTVVAGRNRSTGEKVAIKHIDRVFADKADTVRIIRELRFLRLLRHPNIVAVSEVLIPQREKTFDDIFIVTELLDTDLAHLIKSKTKYDDIHTRWLLFQLLRGLKHIHAASVYHRDLKPGNLLLNANCDLKICGAPLHCPCPGRLCPSPYPGTDSSLFVCAQTSGWPGRHSPTRRRTRRSSGPTTSPRAGTVRQSSSAPTSLGTPPPWISGRPAASSASS